MRTCRMCLFLYQVSRGVLECLHRGGIARRGNPPVKNTSPTHILQTIYFLWITHLVSIFPPAPSRYSRLSWAASSPPANRVWEETLPTESSSQRKRDSAEGGRPLTRREVLRENKIKKGITIYEQELSRQYSSPNHRWARLGNNNPPTPTPPRTSKKVLPPDQHLIY